MSVRPQQIAQVLVEGGPGTLVGEEATPILFALTVADGPTGPLDWTLPGYATRIVDAWVVKTGGAGGAGDAVQLQTGGGAAVTPALSVNVADQTVVRTGMIDDATDNFAAGAVLRVQRTEGAADGSCIVYAQAVRA